MLPLMLLLMLALAIHTIDAWLGNVTRPAGLLHVHAYLQVHGLGRGRSHQGSHHSHQRQGEQLKY